jgi:hypothetical protein
MTTHRRQVTSAASALGYAALGRLRERNRLAKVIRIFWLEVPQCGDCGRW